MFSQTTYLPLAKVTQHVAGTIRMKKNNRYRIEMENELLVTDGVNVWRLNKVKKQVLIDKYKEDPKTSLRNVYFSVFRKSMMPFE